jgi:Spy/CpxP family protein refolding chaperone
MLGLVPVLLLGAGGRIAESKAPPGAPPEAHDGNRADREKMRQQLMDQFRAMWMWKLTEELKLDEKTAARVFPMLSKFDDQERQLGREMGQAYQDLRRLVDTAPNDGARLDALVGKILDLRARRHAIESEKNAAMRKVLTAPQMAKLMLLMPRLHETFRQRIHDALDDARQGEGAGRADARRRFRGPDPEAP